MRVPAVACALVSLLLAALLAALCAGSPAIAQDAGGGTAVFFVTDADGAAVAGAEVGLWNDDDTLQAVTDAAGVARLAGVSPGAWTAWASAESHTSEEQDASIAAGAESTLRFTLGSGVAFSGRVVDDAGTPVAGAYVKALAGGTFEGYSEMKTRAPYARLYTEDDGTFRVRGIPPGAVTTLVVTADGMADARLAVRAQGDGVRPSPVQVVLDRGGVVTGRVVAPDGQPVSGAVVYVVPADAPKLIRNPGLRMFGDHGLVAATTAETGADVGFEVVGLAYDKAVIVLAGAEGFARSAPSDALTLSLAARSHAVTLKLRRPATLEVRLTTPAGAAVTDATVRIGEVFDFGPAVQTADADGAFRLAGLSDGTVEVNIEPKGYLPQRIEAVLTAGEVTVLKVVADPGATVAGTVRDEQGAPLAGVDVALDYEITDEDGGWSSGTAAQTTSDADGRFTLGGLRTIEHTLRATIRGRYALPAEVKVLPPVAELGVVLRRMGSARVRFESPEAGLPVPVSAMVWRHDDETRSGFGSAQDIDDGVLVLRGGEGKAERLSVQFDTFLPFEREVLIPWGEDLDLGTVQLDPGVTVRGRVVDVEGAPVGGALVAWRGLRETVSAADGGFSLAHVSPGTALSVEADGFLPLETTVPTSNAATPKPGEPGAVAAPATLELRRGALVAVRLLGAEGEPLADHWLQFRRPPTSEDEPKGEHLDEAGTDDDGRFEIRLPAGPCRVLFITDEEIHVLATLDLQEGGRESVTVKLEE